MPLTVGPWGVSPLPDAWAPRAALVSGLWDLIRFQRIVQIRGTPASGKTTLRRLLESHIATTDPEYQVFVTQGWNKDTLTEHFGNAHGYLETITGLSVQELLASEKKVVLLFDEAQDSYWDLQLWVEFLKTVDQSVGPYIALFCSFGSAGPEPAGSMTPTTTQTPLSFGEGQVVGLAPSGFGQAAELGLLLDFEEAMDVIKRRLTSYPAPVNFDPALCHFLISFTHGHYFAQYLRRYRDISYDMVREYLADPRVLALALSGSKFARGLLRNDLADPYYHCIFKTMVLDGHLSAGMYGRLVAANRDSGWTTQKLEEHVQMLHRQGFIYSHYRRDTQRPWEGERVWVLPSECHAWYYSVQMAPSVPAVPTITSLKDLLISALHDFNPAQLRSSSCRLGPAGVYSPKEATYHFELYRALHKMLGGSLYSIPEYGKHTNASIDIMIPHYGWGMELLLEGRKIAEHIRRFDAGGAYGEWMATGDMKDYVIVNFRANRPRKVKIGAEFQKFYNVCFDENFTKVIVFHAGNVDVPEAEFMLP
ncbi:hypothetical protein FN846DRAFT_908554 [Sphaerosporella brunnea]|uniref:AAA domain-containing protein n=1 Tax=Sphaerosporella brunnea TaxID=1250544 RepID=A0A5J5ESG1_9PEZI|nr:hypothetical protein FN846DRAFT_908554 [Sphaerosporella brunnea]